MTPCVNAFDTTLAWQSVLHTCFSTASHASSWQQLATRRRGRRMGELDSAYSRRASKPLQQTRRQRLRWKAYYVGAICHSAITSKMEWASYAHSKVASTAEPKQQLVRTKLRAIDLQSHYHKKHQCGPNLNSHDRRETCTVVRQLVKRSNQREQQYKRASLAVWYRTRWQNT